MVSNSYTTKFLKPGWILDFSFVIMLKGILAHKSFISDFQMYICFRTEQ